MCLESSWLDDLVVTKQFVYYQARVVRCLASCFQKILFIQQSSSEPGTMAALHFNPSGESDSRNPVKSFCDWGDQDVIDSRSMHFHRARVLLGEEEWLAQEEQQVGDCCFGSCVNLGARFIDIVWRIQGDKWRFNVLVSKQSMMRI